jgi:hypothetical protein
MSDLPYTVSRFVPRSLDEWDVLINHIAPDSDLRLVVMPQQLMLQIEHMKKLVTAIGKVKTIGEVRIPVPRLWHAKSKEAWTQGFVSWYRKLYALFLLKAKKLCFTAGLGAALQLRENKMPVAQLDNQQVQVLHLKLSMTKGDPDCTRVMRDVLRIDPTCLSASNLAALMDGKAVLFTSSTGSNDQLQVFAAEASPDSDSPLGADAAVGEQEPVEPAGHSGGSSEVVTPLPPPSVMLVDGCCHGDAPELATASDRRISASVSAVHRLFSTDAFNGRVDTHIGNLLFRVARPQWDAVTVDEVRALGQKRVSVLKQLVVAVIDSGIDITHSEFQDNLKITGMNFVPDKDDDFWQWDEFGHGTMCASLIVGSRFGVAPGAKLLVARVIDDKGCCAPAKKFAEAIQWATTAGARVISMSWAMTYDPNVYAAICTALSEGVTFVAAAGNFGSYHHATVSFPATIGDVISVGSVNVRGVSSAFSSVGYDGEVTIVCPGEGVWGATCQQMDNNGAWLTCRLDNGTSYAAPLAAGACLLLLATAAVDGVLPEKLNGFVMKSLLKRVMKNSTSTVARGGGTLDLDRLFTVMGAVKREIDLLEQYVPWL